MVLINLTTMAAIQFAMPSYPGDIKESIDKRADEIKERLNKDKDNVELIDKCTDEIMAYQNILIHLLHHLLCVPPT